MTTTVRSIKSNIRELLADNGKYCRPGHVVEQLRVDLNLIGSTPRVAGSSTSEMVLIAIDELESEGVIKVQRSGMRVDSIQRNARPQSKYKPAEPDTKQRHRTASKPVREPASLTSGHEEVVDAEIVTDELEQDVIPSTNEDLVTRLMELVEQKDGTIGVLTKRIEQKDEEIARLTKRAHGALQRVHELEAQLTAQDSLARRVAHALSSE